MRSVFVLLILTTVFMMTTTVFGQADSGLTVVRFEFKPNENQRVSSGQYDPMLPSSENSLPTTDRNSPLSANVSRRNQPVTTDSPVTDTTDGLSIGGQRVLNIVVELRNISAKRVVGYDLDCVFIEKDNKEYFRYRLVTNKAILAGGNGKAKKTLTASNLPKGAPAAKIFGIVPVETKVEIVAVRFKDGTVWTQPNQEHLRSF